MAICRSWKYRLYPSKMQIQKLSQCLNEAKNLWNFLLENTKKYYEETGKFPRRKQLYPLTKKTPLFSQVAQNVADRLVKSLRTMIARRKAGRTAGFPRFKSIERMKSLTYPQFGFRLNDKLELADIGGVSIKKHRDLQGQIKTLTIKKSQTGKWFAIFTAETEAHAVQQNSGPAAGVDLGVEHFACLSDAEMIGNPRHLKKAEQKLKEAQRILSRKKKGSKNRITAKLKVAIAYEKLRNRRRDFLHKASRKLVDRYSLLALENLNVAGMAKGFLAKHILDCGWGEFTGMLAYKAEEAGCKLMLVEPAYTTQTCSNCGLVRRKSLAERWHGCACGASMPRDLNAAINILKKATLRTTSRSQGSVNDASRSDDREHVRDVANYRSRASSRQQSRDNSRDMSLTTTVGTTESRADAPMYGAEARKACREETATHYKS